MKVPIVLACLTTVAAYRIWLLVTTEHSKASTVFLIPYFLLECLLFQSFYRTALHPLAKYPGPWWAALTDWYTVYHLVVGDRHLDFYKLHRQYGKIVRFGPRRISINSSPALQDIYGANANVQRSQTYVSTKHFFSGTPSSNTTMNWKDHAFRRRVNVQAINPTTIKQMEGRILRNIRYFCSQLIDCKDNGKDVTPGDNWSNARDMTKNVGYLVSDIMGDVIFGRRWETMRRPENRDLITKLPEAVAGIHLTGYMPSLLRLNLDRLLFRRIILGVDRFTSLSKEMFEWRFAQGPQDDLFNALLTAKDAESGASLTTAELVSEAGLLIIAGSDTTKTAITATLFYLLHSPTTLQRLQDEIRTTFATIDDIRIGGQLSGCLFLYACIDETMRLTPSIGSTLMREVRAGGLVVDGEWFPPGTDIGVPHYALHHNEAYFSDPFAFRPERWLSVSMSSNGANAKLEQEQEPSAASASSPAFTPFGVGRTSCIGRYLAYQEISLVIAYMLWQFDMRLQPGSTLGEGRKELGPGRHRKNEFQTLDRFISMHDGPMVEFRQRKDVTG